ncbi:MAG TPA: ABC transporter permease [Fimbriimonadaceae bacterium]|nr:ABC transporter permease [Fimbriimonadaceae bacterium]
MANREGRDPVRGRTLAWGPLALPMAAFLIVPILLLAIRAGPNEILDRLREPAALDALRLSAWTSAVAALVCIFFGAPLAYLLAKGRFPGRRVLDAFVDLPVVLPPAVAGIALLLAFGRRGPVGAWLEEMGWGLSFSAAAVVLAQVFVAAPLFIRSFAGALEQVDRELEAAATLDGAGPYALVRKITFPIAQGGFWSGVALCWARAVGEFGATILFAGNFPGKTQTVPLAIYLGFEVNFDTAVALSAVLLGASVLVLGLVRFVRS